MLLSLLLLFSFNDTAYARMPEDGDDIKGIYEDDLSWFMPEEIRTVHVEDDGVVSAIISSERRFDSAAVTGITELRQYPELPNGCESVALTIVLKSKGFNMSKRAIADNWLVKNHNMAAGYSGDPANETGLSVFTTGLIATARNFLESMESDHICYDLDGTDFYDLLKFIEEGYPVIVWSTVAMEMPSFTGKVYRYSGKQVEWYHNEHCVVLYGFDLTNNTVLVSDPIDGLVERDLDRFREIYEKAGRMAMVII